MFCGACSLFLLLLFQFGYSRIINLNVNISSDPIQNVGAKFVGATLESGLFGDKHYVKHHFKFREKRMQTLGRGLSPCYLRIGGTTADFLTFSEKSVEDVMHGYYGNGSVHDRIKRDIYTKKDLKNFTMTGEMFDELVQFVQTVGWNITFDLNVLKREDGRWDPTNAITLMKYIMKKGYRLSGWELGNEPNDFKHLIGYPISPQTLADDYITLRQILDNYFSKSLLLGPSVTQMSHPKAEEYFEEFMATKAREAITSPTFHQYYINGRTATVEDFTDPSLLDDLAPEITKANSILSQYSPKMRVWLGETSSAYGGGAPGLSDRYVAGFMWLDKLGVSAKHDVDVVVRQSFMKGNYALIDFDEVTPFPDYWLTVLYKDLVGGNVFIVTTNSSAGFVRMYAHCTNTEKSSYTAGSITVYGMNLLDDSVELAFQQFQNQELHLYLLEPGDDGLTSRNVRLNGVELHLTENEELPNLFIPKIFKSTVIIPPKTFAFIVVPKADVSVCKR